MREVKRLERNEEWVMPHIYPHIRSRMDISDNEYFIFYDTHVELDKEPNLLQYCVYKCIVPVDSKDIHARLGACVKEFIDMCESTKKEAIKPNEETLNNLGHNYWKMV